MKIKRGVGYAILLLLIVQAIFYHYSIPVKPTGQTKMVKCNKGTCLLIAGDGSLVGWGWADDGLIPGVAQDIVPIPYFLRRTILRDVAKVTVDWQGAAAVDCRGRLWVWGDKALMPEVEQKIRGRPTLAMEGVAAVALGNRRVAVIMEDGSLWGWGYATQWDGVYHTPYQISEEADELTFRGGRLFYTDGAGTLYEEQGDPLQAPRVLCGGVKEFRYAGTMPWDYLVLTQSGEVFYAEESLSIDGSTDIRMADLPLMDGVDYLTDQGWITENGVYWKVNAQGEIERGPGEIAAFAREDFYVTEDGYLHYDFWPRFSLLAVSTGLRNVLCVLCALWLCLHWGIRGTGSHEKAICAELPHDNEGNDKWP